MSMALVPVPTSDLVYMVASGLSGISGAHRILMEIKPQMHRLDAAHNDLGDEGTVALFRGLGTQRLRFSAGEYPDTWGMYEINVMSNQVGDEGLANAMWYVSEDKEMRKLLLSGNAIELRDVAATETVAAQLGISNLAELSLSSNRLSPAAITAFFDALHAPRLRSLHLSSCRLPSACADAIAAFLASPRSYGLKCLELNGNSLGARGLAAIVDAVGRSNPTIQRLGLHANDSRPEADSDDEGDADAGLSADAVECAQIVETRLAPILKRNRKLTSRVREAAARAIAPTRIIVFAQPADGGVAGQGQSRRGSTASRTEKPAPLSHLASNPTPPSASANSADTPNPTPSFPLLDLPRELQLQIARHCSSDAYALSDAQWRRILQHAEDRSSLSRMIRRCDWALRDVTPALGRAARAERRKLVGEVRDEWLAARRCEFWEGWEAGDQ